MAARAAASATAAAAPPAAADPTTCRHALALRLRRRTAHRAMSARARRSTVHSRPCWRSVSQRLDQERIGDQADEGAEIGRRRRGSTGRRHGDGRSRQTRLCSSGPFAETREERQADRGGEQPHQPQRHAVSRAARSKPAASEIGSVVAAPRPARHMDDAPRGPEKQLDQQMRVGIAGEQRRLEEHHRHRPHPGRAAEPRQHHLGEHRLHGEQQEARTGTGSRRTPEG